MKGLFKLDSWMDLIELVIPQDKFTHGGVT